MNKVNGSEYVYTFGVYCPSVSVWCDSPGDDKTIANLLSCREWGTIYNLFSLYNSLRP